MTLEKAGVQFAGLAALVSLFLAHGPLRAADIEVTLSGVAKTIPIAIQGFSPEVERVVEFDLTVVGFEVARPDKAQYQLQAIAGTGVAGGLKDLVTGRELHRWEYSGGSARAQAHRLSDDVVHAVTGKKGIAQTLIAFKIRGSRGSEVYVADYDGASPRQMTDDGSDVAAPAWVPGRRMLYYTSYRLNNPDIYSHDLTSGARSPVARYSGSNISPAPSPDGSRLAMILSKSGSPNLWVSHADGSGLRRLTQSREGDSSPTWSPDSRTICFTSRMAGRPALYTISADGGTPRPLNTGGIVGATEPDWSPDGQWIAFTRQSGGGFQICVVPARGGETKVLREGEDPSWAPNSRTLIFARRVGNKRALSLLDVPTNRVKDCQPVSGSCSQPSWAR